MSYVSLCSYVSVSQGFWKHNLWAIFLHRALCVGIDLGFLGQGVWISWNYWQHFLTEGTKLPQVHGSSPATAKAKRSPQAALAAPPSPGAEPQLPSSRPCASCSQHEHVYRAGENLPFTEGRTELGVPGRVFRSWPKHLGSVLTTSCDFRFEKHYPEWPHKVLM